MYLNSRLESKFTENWDGDYNSGLGRFISEDPSGFSGKDTNFYRYVSNNSSRLIDPTGEFAISGSAIAVGALIGGLSAIIANLISTNGCVDPGDLAKFAAIGAGAGAAAVLVGATSIGSTAVIIGNSVIGAASEVLNQIVKGQFSGLDVFISSVIGGLGAAAGIAAGNLRRFTKGIIGKSLKDANSKTVGQTADALVGGTTTGLLGSLKTFLSGDKTNCECSL